MPTPTIRNSSSENNVDAIWDLCRWGTVFTKVNIKKQTVTYVRSHSSEVGEKNKPTKEGAAKQGGPPLENAHLVPLRDTNYC